MLVRRDGSRSRQAATPPGRAQTLRDRLLAVRDRLLTSPAFHRFVFSTPLLRGIGNRRAKELFDICAGFVYSQTLLACVRLGVLERLRSQPSSSAELALAVGISESATEKLLGAASALRLVERRSDDRYGLGELGAALLANPGLREMIEHHPELYEDLRDPVQFLKSGGGSGALASYWPYAGAEEPDALPADQTTPYSKLMAASLPAIGEEILQSYRLSNHSTLLDVGGGDGAFIKAASMGSKDLNFILFDLPSVAERARLSLAGTDLGRRSCVVGGNFKTDPLPSGADLISFVRILLDHDDDVAGALLKSAARAIEPRGRVLIAEPMSLSRAGDRVTDAYFGMYLYAMGRGRPRQTHEIISLLRAAGFVNCRLVRNSNALIARIIVADAPPKSVKIN